MNRAVLTILLLVVSNSFMTLAWYGHLKFKTGSLLPRWGLFGIIIISWIIAFAEYCFQVPANRIGFNEFGGPFNLVQLKVIQEVTSLSVFALFAIVMFKTQTLNYNHVIAFILLIGAVFFMFRN
ncbi:MAG: DMT family protein [Candidatus Egerieousia sp.]